MSLFTAKTAMTKEVVTIKEDSTIYDAMKILIMYDFTGIPVVKDDMSIVGIVSEKDMMKPLYVDGSIGRSLVSSVMTREVICFDQNDEMIDVCKCLVENDFRRVPILSEGKLVGIITRKDVIKYILDGKISVETEKASFVI